MTSSDHARTPRRRLNPSAPTTAPPTRRGTAAREQTARVARPRRSIAASSASSSSRETRTTSPWARRSPTHGRASLSNTIGTDAMPARVQECVTCMALGQDRTFEVERFPHPPEHALDLVVDRVRRKDQECGRHLGQQRLELEALGQAALRPAALGAAREQADDEAGLDEEQRDAARDVPLVEVPDR